MKKLIAILVLSLTGVIYWGYDGIHRNKEWVSPDGRMDIQNQLNNMSTAFDFWPTAGTKPTTDSLAELTLYRTLWDNPDMERISISAMASADNGAYRIGVEKAGNGQYRDVIFCFENVSPGMAYCPLKITTTGVYVSDDGINYRKL
jgi:hypothetical protein